MRNETKIAKFDLIFIKIYLIEFPLLFTKFILQPKWEATLVSINGNFSSLKNLPNYKPFLAMVWQTHLLLLSQRRKHAIYQIFYVAPLC